MPQSTAALRQKAEALRMLRTPHAIPASAPAAVGVPRRSVWARKALPCQHGTCLALEVRPGALWVLVRDASGQEAWAPIARILTPDQRRTWARGGFG
jgi:hypothetical protein